MTSRKRSLHQLRRIWALGRHLLKAKKLIKGVDVQSGPRPPSLPQQQVPASVANDPLLFCLVSLSDTHLEVAVQFITGLDSTMSLGLMAMINSGATANFISLDFVSSLSLITLDCYSPWVLGADGKILEPAGKGYCYNLTLWMIGEA